MSRQISPNRLTGPSFKECKTPEGLDTFFLLFFAEVLHGFRWLQRAFKGSEYGVWKGTSYTHAKQSHIFSKFGGALHEPSCWAILRETVARRLEI